MIEGAVDGAVEVEVEVEGRVDTDRASERAVVESSWEWGCEPAYGWEWEWVCVRSVLDGSEIEVGGVASLEGGAQSINEPAPMLISPSLSFILYNNAIRPQAATIFSVTNTKRTKFSRLDMQLLHLSIERLDLMAVFW